MMCMAGITPLDSLATRLYSVERMSAVCRGVIPSILLLFLAVRSIRHFWVCARGRLAISAPDIEERFSFIRGVAVSTEAPAPAGRSLRLPIKDKICFPIRPNFPNCFNFLFMAGVKRRFFAESVKTRIFLKIFCTPACTPNLEGEVNKIFSAHLQWPRRRLDDKRSPSLFGAIARWWSKTVSV